MQFVDYNFVSDEDAKAILESYGYTGKETEEVEHASEEVAEENIEESGTPQLPDCVISREEGVFGLYEDVVEYDGDLYIPVSPIEEELFGALEESEAVVLDTVDFEEESYALGDIFEDEENGDMFVQLAQSE